MLETISENETMATNGIVSIETQQRELEMFYARLLLYSEREGVSTLIQDYRHIVTQYGNLDKGDQEQVDEFDEAIICVKAQIFLQLLELEKSQ